MATQSRTELLYINSRNRIHGTPSDFTVKVPSSMLQIHSTTQKMKISVIDVVLNRSWYSIGTTNNTFTVSDGEKSETYDLPYGYHTVKTLREIIEDLLDGWIVVWDKITNKLVYQPPNDGKVYTFSFDDFSSDLFGFSRYETPSGSHSTPIVSSQPVKVNRESALLIHTDIPRAENTLVDNVLQTEFIESDILIKIGINCAPFDNLIYTASANDLYSFITTSTNITSMRFFITDEHGRKLDIPYNWTMTIKVEYLDDVDANGDANRSITGLLGSIKDYLKLLVLSIPQANE